MSRWTTVTVPKLETSGIPQSYYEADQQRSVPSFIMGGLVLLYHRCTTSGTNLTLSAMCLQQFSTWLFRNPQKLAPVRRRYIVQIFSEKNSIRHRPRPTLYPSLLTDVTSQSNKKYTSRKSPTSVTRQYYPCSDKSGRVHRFIPPESTTQINIFFPNFRIWRPSRRNPLYFNIKHLDATS